MKYLKSIMVAAFCLFAFISCDDTGDEVDTPGAEATAGDAELMEQAQDVQDFTITEDNVMMENMTIAQIVMQSEQFSILEQALNSAGMAQMLGSGSYTVIAPTNDAFEELDEGTLEAWLMNENRDKLSVILQYHVIDQEMTAANMTDGMEVKSVQGSPLMFEVEDDGEIQVGGYEVEYVVHASNGTIFVVGEVLMPDDL